MSDSRPLSYPPSHPWYYLLGHPVLPPKRIRADLLLTDYGGYRADEIAAAHCRAEPQRTRALEALRAEVMQAIRCDLATYRQFACRLHRERQENPEPHECSPTHTALSLKYCHLFNGFAHLRALDRLPVQADLFG